MRRFAGVRWIGSFKWQWGRKRRFDGAICRISQHL